DKAVELSVVITSYNRTGQLRVCLGALSHQTQAPTDFEVIVMVDGSTYGTSGMLADLTTPYRLNVICQENSGHPLPPLFCLTIRVPLRGNGKAYDGVNSLARTAGDR